MLGLGIQLPWKQQALGIPRSGLVCWHDLWQPNILPYSNTFSSWSKVRANVVESASVCAPSGAKAWKLVEDNTAANSHYIYQAAVCQAVTNTWAIRAKAGERSKLCLLNAALGKAVGFTLSGDGATFQSGVTAMFGTYGIEALDDGWYLCWVQDTFKDEPNALRVCLLDGEDALGYDGAGTEPYTEDDPGIYIADVQLYPSSTLPPYAATTDLQTFADLSGHGYSLQRGSTAGADSNDPTVLGPGLSFVTDDYALTGNLSGVSMAGDWTAVLVVSVSATDGYLWTLSNPAATYRYQAIQANGARKYRIATLNSTASTSPDMSMPGSGLVMLRLMSIGGQLVLGSSHTAETVSVANKNPTGVPRIGIGCNAGPTITNIVNSMTACSHLFYDHALSNAEIQRIYRTLKATWAARGVTIL